MEFDINLIRENLIELTGVIDELRKYREITEEELKRYLL